MTFQDPSSSTLLLSSVRDHPPGYHQPCLYISGELPLVNPMTEAFITPHSMIYPSTMGGTHFPTGSDKLICLFDKPEQISHKGLYPHADHPQQTQADRRRYRNEGHCSALALNPSGRCILLQALSPDMLDCAAPNGSGELLGNGTPSGKNKCKP